MRGWPLLLLLPLVALGQIPTGSLYGPLKVKDILPPNLVVLETGHRLPLGGIELPRWDNPRLLETQARRRGLSPNTLRARAQESLQCVSSIRGKEVYIELEETGQGPLAYLFLPKLDSLELALERQLFVYGGTLLDNPPYIWTLQGCAWAVPQGKYASLWQAAEEYARKQQWRLFRP